MEQQYNVLVLATKYAGYCLSSAPSRSSHRKIPRVINKYSFLPVAIQMRDINAGLSSMSISRLVRLAGQ